MLQEFVLQRVIDATHMASHTQEVHGEEGTVEEDVRQREVDLSQRLVHHAAEELGEPVVYGGEHAKDDPSHDIVEVRHDEVSVVDEDVHRGRGHVDTTQAADDEIREET